MLALAWNDTPQMVQCTTNGNRSGQAEFHCPLYWFHVPRPELYSRSIEDCIRYLQQQMASLFAHIQPNAYSILREMRRSHCPNRWLVHPSSPAATSSSRLKGRFQRRLVYLRTSAAKVRCFRIISDWGSEILLHSFISRVTSKYSSIIQP
jgi:hypothetical protein